MPPFRRYIKKLPRHFQQIILDAVEDVLADTDVGQLKTGDLKSIQVYKFTMGRQSILMADKIQNDSLILYQVDPHENFYRDLKKYMKEIGG